MKMANLLQQLMLAAASALVVLATGEWTEDAEDLGKLNKTT